MTVTGSLPDGFKLSVEPVRWMVFAEWEKQTVPVGSGQQNGKLSFVGMPPRAMRAFTRVMIFPSFGHARFVFAVVVYSIFVGMPKASPV